MTTAPATSSARAETPPAATLFFIVTTLAITWLMQLPAALATLHVIPGPPARYLAPAGLGGFAPLIAAILASRRESGREGVRALFRRFRIGGFNPVWYLIALALPSLAYVAGRAVYPLIAGSTNAGRWLYLPENAQHVVAMFLVPLVEEIGWRGFALPRLQPRFGPLRATWIVGFVWAAWHTMMFIAQGFAPAMFAVGMIDILAGSFLFTWLFNRTRGSLSIAVIAHIGAHLNNPTHAYPANPTPFYVYTAATVVLAVGLVAFDRKAWVGAEEA